MLETGKKPLYQCLECRRIISVTPGRQVEPIDCNRCHKPMRRLNPEIKAGSDWKDKIKTKYGRGHE